MAYSETVVDYELVGDYDAWVALFVNNQNGTSFIHLQTRAYGTNVAAVSGSFTASAGDTYNARGYHKGYLNLYDYDWDYPYQTFYYDTWGFGFFEGQGINVPWYAQFLYNGFEQTTRRGQSINLGSTYDFASVTIPYPHPVNFHQVGPATRPHEGWLHFKYEWESSTGIMNDLSSCYIQEVVTQQGGNPYPLPWPFYWYDPIANPFYGPTYNADVNTIEDDNRPYNIGKPFSSVTVASTQRFRYRCGTHAFVNFPVVYTIVRTIRPNSNGGWKYTIAKAGESAEINPLQ